MKTELIYLIQVASISGMMLLFYQVFLKQLTFFKQNRVYLLSALVLPFLMPFIELPVSYVESVPTLAVVLDEFVVGELTPVNEGVSFLELFPIFYLSVSVVLLLRMSIGIVSILQLFKQARIVEFDGQEIYVSLQQVNPFSVFKRIVVNEQTLLDQDALRRIVLHERTHISQQHGIDTFVAESLCVVFWINPFFWILKKELKSTHEYLADEKVLEQDFDLAEYFMLIFNNIVGKNVGLANNFNQSLNLKRMKMMKKRRSPRFARIMSIAAMPVLLVVTLFFSGQLVNANMTEQKDDELKELVVVGYEKNGNAVEKTTPKNPIVNEKSNNKKKVKGKVYKIVDVMPEYPGGTDALMQYLRKTIKYPSEAQMNGDQGKVYVEYVVTKTGEVADVHILQGVSVSLDKEAIRVVEEMPNWTPGESEGKAVNVSYRLPINFALSTKK